MRDSPSKGTALMAYTRFSLDRSTPSLWRVTFDNPPINLIDPVMIVALHDLLAEIEQRCALDASPNRSRQAHHPDIRPVDHLRDQDRPGVFLPRWFATSPQEQIKAAVGETFELVASGILRISEGEPFALTQFAEAVALAEAPAQ